MLLDDDSNLEDHLVCKHEHGGLRYLIVLYQRSYHDTDVQVGARLSNRLPQIYKFLPFQVHFEAMSINPSPTGAFCSKIVVFNALVANFIKSQQKTILTQSQGSLFSAIIKFFFIKANFRILRYDFFFILYKKVFKRPKEA